MAVQRERRRLLIAVSLVLALVLAGCTGQPSDQSSSKEKLKVGAILPLSGPASVFGQSIKKGMELAKDRLKEKGHDVQIVYEDSQASPKKGVKAYKRLSDVENVDVVVSAFSRVSKPLISLSKENRLPLIATLASGEGIAGKNEYSFRYNVNYRQNARVPFGSVITKEKYDKITLLAVKDEFGVSVVKEIRKVAEEKGINIVKETWLQPGEQDASTQLTKIKQKDPGALLFVAALPSQAMEIVRKAKELDIKADMVDTAFQLSLKSSRKKLGNIANGLYTESLPFTMKESGKRFRNSYKKKFGSNPIYPSTFGYDIIRLLDKATKGKSMPGQKISKKIKGLKTFNSVNGKIKIQENGEINPPLVPVRIVNGSLQRVE